MAAHVSDTPFLRHLVRALLALLLAAPATAAQLPRAVPNDHRSAAGQVIAGELHIALEAVLAEWRPRGEAGPMRKALTFAEAGRAPSAPGPMIRTAAGTPVRITIRNTLAHPVRMAGLGDRDAAPAPDTPPIGPRFLLATSLTIAPGETRQIRFTPSRATTSFYTAVLEGPPTPDVEVGLFEGAYIVDPAGHAAPPGERVMMISNRRPRRGRPVLQDVHQRHVVATHGTPDVHRRRHRALARDQHGRDRTSDAPARVLLQRGRAR